MPASRMPDSCTPIWKRRMKTSLLPGQDLVEGAERRAAERHEQRDHPDRHQGAAGDEGAPAGDADAEADEDEHRDKGENTWSRPGSGRCRRGCPVTSHHSICRAPYPFSSRCPPGSGCGPPSATAASTGTITQADASTAAAPSATARPRRRHRSDGTRKGHTTSGHEGQVSGLEVQRDRQHDEEDGEERRTRSARQRPEGEAPRQREGPGRPQLRPHAVADPDVGLGLVADAGRRGEERARPRRPRPPSSGSGRRAGRSSRR